MGKADRRDSTRVRDVDRGRKISMNAGWANRRTHSLTPRTWLRDQAKCVILRQTGIGSQNIFWQIFRAEAECGAGSPDKRGGAMVYRLDTGAPSELARHC